ncbi:MAG: FliM/FliN family flagellar motor switch protein [Pirellulaceae bacterium]|nr:FliM/FliN family flagellar motor switch protein [Planctomycetales bacterium]
MSDEKRAPDEDVVDGTTEAGQSATETATAASAAKDIPVQVAEFARLGDGDGPVGEGSPIDRFYDVNVTVWAELGRVTMSLGSLMQIGEGSVMKLDRPITGPVDLMAQGVRVARGEVVVVDDCFAIRIKEIEPSRKMAG